METTLSPTLQALLDAEHALKSQFPRADSWAKRPESNSRKFANHPIWQLINNRDGARRLALHRIYRGDAPAPRF